MTSTLEFGKILTNQILRHILLIITATENQHVLDILSVSLWF